MTVSTRVPPRLSQMVSRVYLIVSLAFRLQHTGLAVVV